MGRRPARIHEGEDVNTRLARLPAHVRERLDHLASLTPGWDGYGATAPSTWALDTGRGALKRLQRDVPSAIDEVFIVPSVDGGIRFEWVSDTGRELTVIIPSTARNSIHFYRFSAQPAFEEDAEADDFGPLPAMLDWLEAP
jgi:hypothetical protein